MRYHGLIAGMLLIAACSDEAGVPTLDGKADLDGATGQDLKVDVKEFDDKGPAPVDKGPGADKGPGPDTVKPKPDTLPSACKVNCDCAQGLLCAKGTCVAGTKAVYCCTKPGCPAGQACTSPNGSAGVCPGATTCKVSCDCAQSQQCVKGQCITGTKPVYCCSKAGCPAGQACVTPGGAAGTCPGVAQCKSPCDCAQGLSCQKSTCVKATPPVYCCTSPGCPTGQKCVNPGGTTGLCGSTPQCKVDCDCIQGLMCTGGKCIAAFLPVYCCDKAGCPAGKKCTDKAGNPGTCP